eukprot:2548726-Rhodomonas_salina.1
MVVTPVPRPVPGWPTPCQLPGEDGSAVPSRRGGPRPVPCVPHVPAARPPKPILHSQCVLSLHPRP